MMWEILFSVDFLQELLFSMIRMATPILFAALGEVFSERAGLINIGLEGLMTSGAVFGFIGTYFTGSVWLGMLFGVFCAIAVNMIYGYATIHRKADQIVNGMALNIFALGLASFTFKTIFGITETMVKIEGFKPIPIPILSKIPFFGNVLFNHTAINYIAVLLVPLSWIFLFHTKLGLKLRSVGEHPKAADTLGINVMGMKYFACALAGAFAGLGGVYLTLANINMYMDNMVAGRGFIALAAVIFGRWNPVGVLLASLLFGFADAVQLRIQALGFEIPYQFMLMLPYLLTMVALAGFVGRTVGPAAKGKPYFRESK